MKTVLTPDQFPKIRPATAKDAGHMHAMLREIARVTDSLDKFTSTKEDIIRDGFGNIPAFHALIGETDAGMPLAMCLYFDSYSTFRGKAGIYIQDLYVDSSLRGGGFARYLFAHVAAHARQNNRHYIRLSVDAENMTGQKFYRKIGMKSAVNERIFVLDGDALSNLASEAEILE
ncbi:GNAT family N-acetyltransferase [Thalassospira sp. MCCC 1A01428]|uniref:GNAT family N-acetyltransferase n=1 Tax=Thalassospira sp. MCCC 1A01428 TaxID=1470575 RepID=UPI000A1FA9D1|nr:GNAT family N-acetyltransferase [Thalassospira sp. MCCC 1A01428]OSQ42581.1 acetyltransferase [Thalassospira sp. MCCC 1A01428]